MSISAFLKRPFLILAIIISLFFTYFSFVAVSRHNNFYSRRLDLGNMDQVVWNVANGNGFTLTDPKGEREQSRLAVHADFLLIAMAPLYTLWNSPNILVVLQALVICLGAVPLFFIAKKILSSGWLAFAVSISYLFYPPIQKIMLHDFHAVALSGTFLLAAYLFLLEKKYGWMVLFSFLAGLGKEQVWIITGMLGVYVAFFDKKRFVGLSMAAVSVFMFIFLFWFAIPKASIDQKHWALTYLSEYGEEQTSIISSLLQNPIKVISTMFLPDRIYYYFELLSPVAFLPLVSPWVLLFGAPDILINSLSNNGLLRQIDYQYTSLITPWIFIAATYGVRQVSLWKKKITIKRKKIPMGGILACIILITSIWSTWYWGELPIGRWTRLYFFTSHLTEHEALKKAESLVPPGYSVSVTNNIGAHFTQRRYVYNFPVKAEDVDYIIAFLGDPYAWPSGDAQREMVEKLKANSGYELVIEEGKLYMFKKKGLP